MPYLDIITNSGKKRVEFLGEPLLSRVLSDNGFYAPHPCGGRGVCGKCAVSVSGVLSELTERERELGKRLSCQTRLLGNAEVIIEDGGNVLVEQSAIAKAKLPLAGRIGAAVDIGTTTIAVCVYDLAGGRELGRAGGLNPQTAVASDVLGRISAAIGGRLTEQSEIVRSAVIALLLRAYKELPDVMVVTGNTAMLYLFTGRSPEAIACTPFKADCLFGFYTEIEGIRALIPPCASAFTGADVICAALSCGLTDGGKALLCDIGTNSEIALFDGRDVFTSSAAAGPAFEGGTECGMLGKTGAIDRVWLEGGRIRYSVIGGGEPRGICGSGLLDALCAFLRLGMIDETGFCEEERLQLSDKVYISRADVRAMQLAKAAVAAGIRRAAEVAGVPLSDISAFYIAGGFGSRLSIPSASAVGLIPRELAGKAKAIGNAALSGAAEILTDNMALARAEGLAASAKNIQLGGDKGFEKLYIAAMNF